MYYPGTSLEKKKKDLILCVQRLLNPPYPIHQLHVSSYTELFMSPDSVVRILSTVSSSAFYTNHDHHMVK